MKNEMYRHLLEKFATINLNMLPGGALNPENTWAFRMIDTLSEVAAAIENGDTDLKKVTAAFQKLKDASEAMLGRGREGVPGDMQPLFTALLAAQKPLGCCLQNLKNGKTLDEALADPSWMDGLFNSTPDVKEREGYVAGSYTTEGKTYQQIIDTYKEDAAQAGVILDKHLKALSGDSYDPDGMIQARISLMQDFINSHADEPNKAKLEEIIGAGYGQIRDRFNQKKMVNLGDLGHIMSDDFFGHQMDLLVEPTQVAGQLDAMKTLSEDTLRLLHQETKKLRLKSGKMGFSKELVERFEKNSYNLQALSQAVEALRRDFEDVDENEATGPLVAEIDAAVAKTLAYVRGEKDAQLPADEEFISIAKHVLDYTKGLSLFDENAERSDLYADFALVINDLCKSVPHLAKELQPAADFINTRTKVEALQLQEELLSGNTSPERADAVDRGIKNLYNNGIIGRDFQMKAIYVRMARDPAFNQKMIEEASGAISEFAKNMDKKPGVCKSSLFVKNHMMSGNKFTPEELYKDAYTMYLLGRQIQMENKKLQALKGAEIPRVEKIRNPLNPNLEKLITGKAMDASCVEAIDKAVDALRKTPLFADLLKNGPKVVDTVIHQEEAAGNMIQSLTEPETDYLKELTDSTINILTQTSGAYYRKNSESFQKMSDALKAVSNRKASMEEVKMSDYQELYDAAEKYVLSHDADPGLKNGKLRMGAALNVMNTIGRRLAAHDPEFAKRFEVDHAINMARNKEYRHFAVKSAEKQIQSLISKNAAAYRKGFEHLPAAVQTKITRQLQIVALGNGLEQALDKLPGKIIGGKYSDRAVRDTVKTTIEKVKEPCRKFMAGFKENPDSILRNFEPATLSLRKEARPVKQSDEITM